MTTLASGTRLGPYEILGPIGSGGMGEVYKANDSRLDREVAIKVLPPHWADSADMKERFDREAQIIASLNHPHICALHDIGEHGGVSFLVMEYLEGETLAARLERGPLGLDEALDIAIPVLDALDQAHRRGVVHRDLKPANVMLAAAGPKLLDFGIAKAPTAAAAADVTSSSPPPAGPVPTTPLTTPGLLIGTLQYMAPEQLDGLEADARTDIFAFGAVLHEMITGRRAFEGESQVLLISSIATADPPPLSSVEPATPPALEHVVRTCLAKNPNDRWQTARDLLAELRWIADGGAAADPVAASSAAPGRRRRAWRFAGAAAALAAALAFPATVYLEGPGEPSEERHRVASQAPVLYPPDFANRYFALSPDGARVAFVAETRGDSAIYVGRVGSISYTRLPGTEDASQPFWSADGRAIGFVTGGSLKRVDAAGGPPQDICSAPGFTGGAWNADGVILFGSASGIQRVSAEGGSPSPVTAVEAPETGHFWPHFLPDGRRFLFLAWSSDAGSRALTASALDSPDRTRVMPAESNAGVTAAGHLVFQRDGSLYAQPFDLEALAVLGDPVRLADEVLDIAARGLGVFDVARDGSLAYFDRRALQGFSGPGDESTWDLQLVWTSTTGPQPEPVGPAAVYRGAEVSPDGTRIAVHQHDEAGGDVWVIEPGGARRRITFEPSRDNSSPVWSPDGETLVFSSRRDGKWGLYVKPSNGAGVEELLFEDDRPKAATAWSPDGTRILFWAESPETAGDLWMLPLEGDVEPQPVATSPADETHGQISPDGRWVAYASNATVADQYEIYVQPFPSGPGLYQVSTAGGDWPRWGPDGSRLYFLDPVVDIGIRILNAVDVSVTGQALDHASPQPVIRFMAINFPHAGANYATYAVAPDGRLLVIQLVLPEGALSAGVIEAGPDDMTDGEAIVIARNWEAALRENR